MRSKRAASQGERRHGDSETAPGQRTTAKIVIERLVAHGIDTLFCLPGVQNDPFFDALYDETNRIRPIHTRHEQGAAYLALGAAMATGKPSAYCVVPGPGFLNTTAALSQAYGNNAPVLAIAGQVPLRLRQPRHRPPARHPRPARHHAAPDQMVGPHPRAARGRGSITDEAFRQMVAGRPRPVAIECPLDVWGKATEHRVARVAGSAAGARARRRCASRPRPRRWARPSVP